MASRGPTYQEEVRHLGLNKFAMITGKNPYVVQQKAAAQRRRWNEEWAKKLAAERAREASRMSVLKKEAKVRVERNSQQEEAARKEARRQIALNRTAEAQRTLSAIDRTLQDSLDVDIRIKWDTLLDRSPFPKVPPPEPTWFPLPAEPKYSDPQFAPQWKWFYIFFSSLSRRADRDAKSKFILARDAWSHLAAKVEARNKALEEEWNVNKRSWLQEKELYDYDQTLMNGQVLDRKKAFSECHARAVIEYFDMVMSKSHYPEAFPQEWNLEYLGEPKTVVVDYFLPSPDDLPKLKEVKYVVSKDEFQEIELQESAFNKMYDKLLHQIALRTIHEIYQSDETAVVGAVIFNGWVRSVNRGTGKPITVCVLSIQAPRAEFQKIDLRHVDPKTCFKLLKGIGSSQLHGLSPIAPILQLNRQDDRFVSSYSIVGKLDQSTNLAAMYWEDFEHLIRELFEKEFSQNGGEVKITQASRDGGVDAVAFDPDPIRGGKIVIQAKRYTNTVGVSAVRDLYGTVLNEGATKGILVTTADYGSDAYGFAKGKPLTLLSGSNLLHLLEKHGRKASIDLRAAKQILADQKRAETERE